MESFFIYILYSESYDKFYVGYSSNPWIRLKFHNNEDKNSFTSKHRPWSLAAIFKVLGDRGEAMKIERFIKNQKSKSFLRKLIDPTTKLDGHLAQLVSVPSIRD